MKPRDDLKPTNANVNHIEVEKMACTWFGEVTSCSSLTLLLGPAWVLLNYVLQTILGLLVQVKKITQNIVSLRSAFGNLAILRGQ